MSEVPFAAVRDWMFRDALPFWAAHGVDHLYGGFYEELNPDGSPTACSFKRVRVMCRQTYVFSHAAVLGWREGARLSQLGADYLVKHARTADGGWARLLSREGAIIDATPDLYDLAFVIFAMAWRYRASKDPDALKQARATLDFIQHTMRAPAGGFWPPLPQSNVLLQNPHMHLAEACLAAFEASADQRFLDQATEIVALLQSRIFDGHSVGERFSADWLRMHDEAGRAIEPGHHFEWIWILAQYQGLAGRDVSGFAPALADFAERCGVDLASHAVYDAVRDDGVVLRGSARAWTSTERIKAWLALYELTGRDPREPLKQSLGLLFGRYFATSLPGMWIDQFDEQGAPMVEAVPASIVYHLFLAFSEVLRLEPRLRTL